MNQSKNRRDLYDSANGPHPSIEELRELIRFRDLIIQLVRRDLVSRYKRSILGIAWTMLNPLGTMTILTIVFSRVFGRVESYPVYVLTGLIVWNFFSQTTRHCIDSTLWGSNLFQRIFLPRTAFIISSIGSGIINFLISLIPLSIIMVITGIPFKISIILIPFIILILAFFSLGVGLLLSTYSIYFPDIAEMYTILLTAWMYLSPVIIPEETLGTILNGWLLRLNPLYYLIKLFREIIYEGVFPSFEILIIALGISLTALLIGWIIFTEKSKEFAYYA